jgi:hypothetical protein
VQLPPLSGADGECAMSLALPHDGEDAGDYDSNQSAGA